MKILKLIYFIEKIANSAVYWQKWILILIDWIYKIKGSLTEKIVYYRRIKIK